MVKSANPELKKLMDKRLLIHMNGKKTISGVLRGYDPFLNLVLDDVMLEDAKGSESSSDKTNLGSVVVRGNSIVNMEALERV